MQPTLTRVAIAGVSCVLATGCATNPEPKIKQVPVEPTVVRDISPLLRGTIGSESEFRGVQPILVSGFGLVVGLNGTGGDVLPENVLATMEREMGLMGVGRDAFKGTPIEGKSPRQILRDPNVAVVIVQASIPPGSPINGRFDLYLEAMNATSIEGGMLWTTELRVGPPATFGAIATKPIAKARGPVFINPFSERGRENEGVTRRIGRVLDGGVVTQPNQIELLLDSNSHARARSILSTINSRFPEEPGDPGDVARGRNISDVGGSLALRIPRSYRSDPGGFIQLVAHLPIAPIGSSMPEQFAKRYVDGLKAEPALAEDLSWCLEAVGKRSIPFLRELYDYPELAPRIAALKAGARLNDPLAAEPLKHLVRTGSGGVRTKAIELLGVIDGGPTVDTALQELLSETDLVVRVSAYEALARRASQAQAERIRSYIESNPSAPRLSPSHIDVLAQGLWPRRNFQRIERQLISDKCYIDVVPFGEPLIYVTQQGQPRIVIFGQNPSLIRPAIIGIWSDRLLIKTSESHDRAQIRYSPVNGPSTNHDVPATLTALVEFMGRTPTPEDSRPGLGLTYSELVGALAGISESGGIRAAFATEQDKLKAQVLAAGSSRDQVERPEKPGEDPIVIHQAPSLIPTPDSASNGPTIVPITPPTDPKNK